MKKISILFFFYFLLTISVFAQWTKLNSGTTNYLSSVAFTNKDTGYVVGLSGTILKTTDGGLSWNPQNSGTTAGLYQVVFMNANNGIIVGDSGIVLKTTNAGQVWTKENSGTKLVLSSVAFSSLNNGVAVGDNATILKTNNGGITWIRLPAIPSYSDTTYFLSSIHFSSANIGYADGGHNTAGMTSIILKTTDGGNSWVKTFENNNVDPFALLSLFPANDNIMWTFGFQVANDYNPKFIFTNDGGNTWTIPGCSPGMPLCWGPYSFGDGIFFTNINTGYIAATGKIYFTIDGGISWSEQYIDSLNAPTIQFDGIFFVNDTIGYIVGAGGSIYKTVNGGGILGINEYSLQEKNIRVFPNPTSGVFQVSSIKYQVSSAEIYNVMGEKVYSTMQQFNYLPTGLAVSTIDISSFPEGMYFVRIIVGGNNYSKKIIKLK